MTTWTSQLDPVLALPFNSGTILFNVSLTPGRNVINHKLGKTLQGWTLCGINGPSVLYDQQSLNPLPELNLWLQASSAVTVNLLVF